MPSLNPVTDKLKYLLMLFALVFAFVALNAGFALMQPASDRARKLHDASLFTDFRVQQFELLERQSLALRKPLEFMVWSREREELGETYLQALRRQINLQPFDFKLWPQLIYAQGEANIPLAQQRWAMARAVTLNRWSVRGRSLIMRPCLIQSLETMRGDDLAFCSELFASLPTSMSINQPSMLMGVNPKVLLDVLVKQGLRDAQGLAQ